MARFFIACVPLLLVLAATCAAAQQQPDASAAAAAFCKGDAIKSLKCGWAGATEQSQAAPSAFGGTFFAAEPNPPQTLTGDRQYQQAASKMVSLACKPALYNLRTIYKLLPGDQGSCSRLILDSKSGTLGSLARFAQSPGGAASITRCPLRLTGAAAAANGTDAAAVKAAVAAADTLEPTLQEEDAIEKNKCTICTDCASCGKAQVGVWLAEFTDFSWDGCDRVLAKPQEPYTPTLPGVVLSPGSKVFLAELSIKPVV